MVFWVHGGPASIDSVSEEARHTALSSVALRPALSGSLL
jgi:hypothetical protein